MAAKPSSDRIAHQYDTVCTEVRTKSPEMWAEVIGLCAAVPDKITLSQIWQHGRDKPCWSNIKVKIGERISAEISKSADFESFHTIASDDWNIVMKKSGPRWKANDNFELTGAKVKAYIASLPKGGLSSYLWKLYAIRNLAIALKSNETIKNMVENLSIQGRIHSNELRNWTRVFSKQIGMGWGIVTVYHMLTDLGLTPKPDLHLKKSAIRMGLLNPNIPSDYSEQLFNTVDEHDIVLAVISLAELVTPTACPTKPQATLREVDKVLMEWSRQGFCRPL